MRGMIVAYIGAEPDDAVVGRCVFTVMAPCLILAISHRRMLSKMIPGITDFAAEVELLVDHMEHFISSGLDAVAQRLRSEKQA